MRRFHAVVVVSLALSLGCVSPRPPQSPVPDLTTRANNETEEDGPILLHLAILERPLGDRVLNREVWAMADEQVLLEQKATLLANGFRVCVIGGQLPAGLQTLLQSPRSCPTLRQINTHLKTPTPIQVGPVHATCAFRLEENGVHRSVELKDAQCLLEVTASSGEEGKLRLRFTPHVRYGQETIAPHPTPNPAGPLEWSWEARRPEEVYSGLGWELNVASDEYVVVGLPLESLGETANLGEVCFVSEKDRQRTQRLVVVRAATVQPLVPADEALTRSPPLALRAVWSSQGGSPP
jgi:hypothetical protein